MSEIVAWDGHRPRWMWDGKVVEWGYDPASGVDPSAIVAMMKRASTDDWMLKAAQMMNDSPDELPVASRLKSPLAIRQVHPEVSW